MTYADLMKKCISEGIGEVYKAIKSVQTVRFGYTFEHILERSFDRSIEAAEIKAALTAFAERGMCQFLYYNNLSDDTKPWRLFVSHGPVIMHFSKRDEDWVFATILVNGEHNKTRDESNSFTAYIDL